jgi:hypothetical protein
MAQSPTAGSWLDGARQDSHGAKTAAMAASKATTSTNAAPGRWKPMSHDQAAFSVKGQRFCFVVSPNEPRGHGHHGDVERGPKIQFGGFHDGLAKPAYQLTMFGVVAREPMPVAAKVTAMKRMRAANGAKMLGCLARAPSIK